MAVLLSQLVAAAAIIDVALALRQDWVSRQPAAAYGVASGALGARWPPAPSWWPPRGDA